MGGMARQAHDPSVFAQPIVRGSFHLPEPLPRSNIERMGAPPLLENMALQAEIDGRRGEPAGIRLRTGVKMAPWALAGLQEMGVGIEGRIERRIGETGGKEKGGEKDTRQEEHPG